MFWKQKQPAVVWRDKNGNIYCPGDDCKKDCEDSCPIWLNTHALEMLQIGKHDAAIRAFKKATEIAPDFVDVHNNLGTAYGMNDQYEEAMTSFSRALQMRPRYIRAMNGLILSEMHLGKYESSLAHCDELESWGSDASSFRQRIRSEMSGRKTTVALHYLDVTTILLDAGREEGYIQSRYFTQIPEILVRADEVCAKVISGISKYAEENPGEIDTPSSAMLVWSALAGIGAVYHWHIDWNTLSEQGIYEVLTEDRGLFEMDEYVYDAIGVGFGSEEEREITRFLWAQAAICLKQLADSTSSDSFMSCAKAMYLFGMVYEMNRLGM